MQADLLYLQSRKFHHVTAEFNNLFDKGSFRRAFDWTRRHQKMEDAVLPPLAVNPFASLLLTFFSSD